MLTRVAPSLPSTPVRPLLKWAGGKRQLLPALRTWYPQRFTRYIEPFTGSGAVFFDLYNTGSLRGKRVRLTDLNPDLIGCYRMVRDRTEDVIAALAALETKHHRRAHLYYDVREQFNERRARAGLAPYVSPREGRRPDAVTEYTPDLAAMLIYLNRTGFNGLFRLNRDGGFNVPAGRYLNPTICDPAHLRGVARALSAPGLSFECAPFDRALGDAGEGDFVYCDPPYAPLSRTASFAHYTADGFNADDQLRLASAIMAAATRGAMLVVSNSSAPEIEAAYATRDARRAGLVVHRIPARRAINSKAGLRGPVDELVITNVRLRMARAAAPLPPAALRLLR